MVTMSVARLAELTSGTIVAGTGDLVFTGVGIDSRHTPAGGAFFALPGDRSDGHVWVPGALGSGARVAVVSRWDDTAAAVAASASSGEFAAVLVPETAAALRSLASANRASLRCPVIAITGSTGKTSTKDFVAAALGAGRSVVATRGNRNNELGVPLTLLEADNATDLLVVEMGMRAEGEIAALCAIARPTIGIVTNIGQTHLEALGSQDAIVRAKGELVACVPSTGMVFLNGDDERSRSLAAASSAPVTWYGLSEGVDVRASDIEVDETGRATFTLTADVGSITVSLPVPGRHNAYNAAAAAAAALYLGTTLDEIAAGLAAAVTTDMRMQVFTAATGVVVVNDAYNASPTSMRAALATLVDMRAAGRRIAVLGDMAELGSLTELAHFSLGEVVARSGIDVLVTVGARALRIADGAVAEGMEPSDVRPCEGVEEASEVLDDLLAPGDLVLVKASRCMQLERIIEGMLNPHV
ncbi:MAG TPA: UDP-N-acetylmuramoyl-tripeptide--D-alanyl-D-alanine ligase [Coriobacteriia bacterium]